MLSRELSIERHCAGDSPGRVNISPFLCHDYHGIDGPSARNLDTAATS